MRIMPAQAGHAWGLRGPRWIASRREVDGEGLETEKPDEPTARPYHRQERRGLPRPRRRRGARTENPGPWTIRPGRASAPAMAYSESPRNETPTRVSVSCACPDLARDSPIERERERGDRGLSWSSARSATAHTLLAIRTMSNRSTRSLYPVELGGHRISRQSEDEIKAILGARPEISKSDIVRLGITLACAYMSDRHANLATSCKVCGAKVTLSDGSAESANTVPSEVG